MARLLPYILVLLTYSQGATIQKEGQSLDFMKALDMFPATLADLESWMDSPGRSKRAVKSGYKTFGPIYGVQIGLKYTDPANKLDGGEFFIHIEDMQKIVKKAPVNEVKIHVKFDSGSQLIINYHITHTNADGVEEGEVKLKMGRYSFELSTKTKPFGGKPIIPVNLGNIKFGVKHDVGGLFIVRYINQNEDHDYQVQVTTEKPPRKEMNIIVTKDKLEIVNQKLVVIEWDLCFFLCFGKYSNTAKIQANGTLDGQIVWKPTGILIDLDFMGTQYLHVEVKWEKLARITKYIIKANSNNKNIVALAGDAKVALPMELKAMAGLGRFKIIEKSTGYGFSTEIGPGLMNLILELFENHKPVFEYDVKLTKNVRSWTERSIEARSSLSLNPTSKLYQYLSNKNPQGDFKTREINLSIYVDKVQNNQILPKVKILGEIKEDNNTDFHLLADTTGKPYMFELRTPNLSELLPYDIETQGIQVTVDHDLHNSLNLKSNICGGLELQISQEENMKGGRDVEVFAKKAGEVIMTYDLSSSFINDAVQFKFGLYGDLNIDKSPFYKINFTYVLGEIEIFFDKVNKNTLFNQWKLAAKVDQDILNVLDVTADFSQGPPYEIKVFAPGIRDVLHLEDLTTGNEGVLVRIDHQPGQYLDIVANLKKFSGLKIISVGNTKELIFNSLKFGSSEFSFSENKIEFVATKYNDSQLIKYLENGDNVNATITWKEHSSLKNEFYIDLEGNKGQLDLTLIWDFSHLNFDLFTPSNASISLKIIGKNHLLGNYKVTRKAYLTSVGKAIDVSWSGDDSFQKGSLAEYSPIHTDITFEFDAKTTDITGKISKNFNGEEYSITFPKGSGFTALPEISLAGY